MTTQVLKDLSNEDYHAHPAVSKSALDEFNRSPYQFWLKYLADEKPPAVWTDAFTVGSALHSLVLEPQNFGRDFYLPYSANEFDIANNLQALKDVCIDLELPRSGSKAELKARIKEADSSLKFEEDVLAAYKEQNADKIAVSQDQYDLCEKMAKSVRHHPEAEKYIDGFGDAEVSLFWEHEGLACRARPDYIREDGVIVDLKTAQSASPSIWSRKAFDFRYHVQAAFYSLGYTKCFGEPPKEFVFVVVEKAFPFCVTVARCDQDFIAAGWQDLMTNLNDLMACKKTNSWPSYNNEQVLDLTVPSYKRKQYSLEEVA